MLTFRNLVVLGWICPLVVSWKALAGATAFRFGDTFFAIGLTLSDLKSPPGVLWRADWVVLFNDCLGT